MKFKKGDRVRNLQETIFVPKGATGTVDEDIPVPFVIWDEVTEVAKKYPNPMRWSQYKKNLELIPKEKHPGPNDPLGIIGKKMRGFKFSDQYKSGYVDNMDKYIGQDGNILCFTEAQNAYQCEFSDGATWHYPAELITQNLIEPKELTLLEKFEAGWEIKHKDGTIAVHIVKQKLKYGYIIEWSDGCVVDGCTECERFITCTPPRETKTVYLHLRTLTGDCFVSHEILTTEACVLIDTLTLEKVDGKWQLK